MNEGKVIPLFSAAKANAGLDLLTPMARVVDRHWYVLGEEVLGFETEFAAYVGVAHCVSVASGSDALELALRTLGIGYGQRVVTVANAGFYGSTAIHAIGAIPVYVDIDPESLTLCPQALAKALDSRPDALIVTHLYGQLARIEPLLAMARTAGIPLIEDCAQAHGARRDGRQAGSFGDLACFSFYPTKNLGALGDGGAVLTDNPLLAERLRQLRQYGWDRKYRVSVHGGRNSRMDELQAAVLRTKLPHLNSWNEQRRIIATRYNTAFKGLELQLPTIADDHVVHLYVLRLADRERFAAALRAQGVVTDIHYPIADHHQPAYPQAHTLTLPHTEAACNEVVSLPCFPGMDDGEIQQVVEAVRAYFITREAQC